MEQKFHVGVKALILNEKKEILLLRANPEELKIEKTHWDLPGGRIEGNDSIEETLVKEVEEELGTRDIEIIEHFDTLISNFKIPLEDLEYKWADIEEAKELLKVKFPDSFIQKLDSLES